MSNKNSASKFDFYREIINDIKSIEKEINTLSSGLKNDKIIVSNAGLYNVGKSSFFNALIDSKQSEFKVADRRETSENKVFNWTSDIDLVDTPGIDAFNDKDKIIALESFKRSDVILFLHNINQGELIKSEIEFIEELIKLFPSNDFWDRIVFIMTRIDLKEDDDDYPTIIDNIKNQISKIRGSNKFAFFEVSSEKYLEGYKEDLDILMEESNIINVRNEIKSIAKSLKGSKKDLIHKKIELHSKNILEKKQSLDNLKKEKINTIKFIKRAIESEEQSFNSIMSDIKYEWKKVKIYRDNL